MAMHTDQHEQLSITERRRIVAERYIKGDTQEAIAGALGLNQATISRDLKAIRAAWLISSIRDFDAAKAEELQKIDQVEREAWAAWSRSTEDKEITAQQEDTEPGDTIVTKDKEGNEQIKAGPERVRRRVSLRREGQAGNPAFLTIVLTCVERRCAILGLDAPRRFLLAWDELTDEQIDRLAAGESPERVIGKVLSA